MSKTGGLTWNARKKKLIFHSELDTQYLLMTVILIDAMQYAMIDMVGLLEIEETGMGSSPGLLPFRGRDEGTPSSDILIE